MRSSKTAVRLRHSVMICMWKWKGVWVSVKMSIRYNKIRINSQWKYTIVSWWEWLHDDVIKWKKFPRYWPFVRGIHRSPVNSPHKGQWRGALMFTLICARINGWVNNREAGDLRRYRTHYDVIVMMWARPWHWMWRRINEWLCERILEWVNVRDWVSADAWPRVRIVKWANFLLLKQTRSYCMYIDEGTQWGKHSSNYQVTCCITALSIGSMYNI